MLGAISTNIADIGRAGTRVGNASTIIARVPQPRSLVIVAGGARSSQLTGDLIILAMCLIYLANNAVVHAICAVFLTSARISLNKPL